MLLIPAIPAVGYAAYLLPLRRESETAAFLFANHVSDALFDAPTERRADAPLAARRGAAARAGAAVPALDVG